MSKKKNKILTTVNDVVSMLSNPTKEAQSFRMHTVILLDVPPENFLKEGVYLTQKIKHCDSRLKCSVIQAHEWSDRNILKIREELDYKHENHFVIIPKGLMQREDEITKFTAAIGSQYFHIATTLPLEEVNISDLSLWQKCQVDVTPEQKIFVFGDVHESVYAWKNLNKKVPEGTLQISLGDIFDKGFDTERTLDLAEEFVANGNKIIIGNHESYVARRLLGKIVAANVEEDYFTSLAVFNKDEKLAERFLKIYEQTLPFIRLTNQNKIFYLTHAPCYVENLGKLNNHSQQMQRNFYFSSREPEQMKRELAFLNPTGSYDDREPIHIFGHINHTYDKVLRGNKIWLDTSAVFGNKLTGLLMDYGKPMIELSVLAECRIPQKKEHARMVMR